ncbi:MAG: hypothetical protein AB7S59_23465, partial [Parvibaculaceae bacterium]
SSDVAVSKLAASDDAATGSGTISDGGEVGRAASGGSIGSTMAGGGGGGSPGAATTGCAGGRMGGAGARGALAASFNLSARNESAVIMRRSGSPLSGCTLDMLRSDLLVGPVIKIGQPLNLLNPWKKRCRNHLPMMLCLTLG